jgi:uncharacterized protein YndB with AHSA1/START domain
MEAVMDDDVTARQMRIGRVFRAPVAAVWRAWTDPEVLPRWFGPQGIECLTKEIDLRDGGVWRFDMIGFGQVWPNRHRDFEYTPMSRIHFLMDDDSDEKPPFDVVVTITAEGDGTRLEQVMTFPDLATKAGAEAMGAVELGQTTLAKLAAIVEG